MSEGSDKKGTRPYIVRQGDYLASIAYRSGVEREAISGDSRNAELVDRRGDLSILTPGDILYVPETNPPSWNLIQGNQHQFSGGEETVFIAIILIDDDGNEIVNEPYRIEGVGAPIVKATNEMGSASFECPVHCKMARLVLEKRRILLDLMIGEMDSYDECTGALKRLANMGQIPQEYVDNDPKRVVSQIINFQLEHGVRPSGILCDATLDAIREAHRS